MIIDEVLMGGRSAQERLAAALSGVPVVWVRGQCDPDVAEARERVRLDRVPGMARLQAGGCMKVSSTTWSWAAIVISPAGPRRHISGSWGERMMFTPVGCGVRPLSGRCGERRPRREALG